MPAFKSERIGRNPNLPAGQCKLREDAAWTFLDARPIAKEKRLPVQGDDQAASASRKTASLRRPSDQIQTSTRDRVGADTLGVEQHDLLALHVLLGRDTIPYKTTEAIVIGIRRGALRRRGAALVISQSASILNLNRMRLPMHHPSFSSGRLLRRRLARSTRPTDQVHRGSPLCG